MGDDPQGGVIERDPGRESVGPTIATLDSRTPSRAGDPSLSPAGLVPSPRQLNLLAFGIVIVPFAFVLVRLLISPGAHLYLPDDLALIDLHTRRALRWQQQLGVFDRNNWNHPGPSLFYLLSVVYRVIGPGAKAMYVGATLINALSAVGCVAIVRRRTTPARTLWAAMWICLLAAVLASTSTGSITYSEGPLGALVSPWNPLVVIFPLLLMTLLCAAAVDRSTLSLIWAVVIGSFVVQTNISTLPLVAALLAGSAGIWGLTIMIHWGKRGFRRWIQTPRQRRMGASEPAWAAGDEVVITADKAVESRPIEDLGPSPHPRRWPALLFGAFGVVVFVGMWVPPVIQQLTNQPGNLGLIVRFFRAGGPGQSVKAGAWTVVAALDVIVHGPAEIMSSVLGGTPRHAGMAVALTTVVLMSSLVVMVVGIIQRNRFAAGMGVLSLLGVLAMTVAATRIVGLVFGYLVIWAVVLPVTAFIGVGTIHYRIRWKFPSLAAARQVRFGLCLLVLLAFAAFTFRAVEIPALGTVSDPQVGQLLSLVEPYLEAGDGKVFVGDNDAGGLGDNFLDTERFIGLVNQLDQRGFDPRVDHLWTVEFGPSSVSAGGERRQIQIYTWSDSSPALPGYVGKVGNMAVTVTDVNGAPVPGSRSP